MESEIDYQTLKDLIDETPVKYGEMFEFLNHSYHISLTEHTPKDQEQGYPPVFWKIQTDIVEFDIYIPTNLVKKKFRKAVLFHETLEAALYSQIEPELGSDEALNMAHSIAVEQELRYAKETIKPKHFNEYLALREELLKH
jgi:hypothetical protein